MAERAILLEPENAAFLDTIGWIHYKIGNIDSAVIYIKQSVTLEDTNAIVLEHLGDALIGKMKLKEA